MSKPRKEGRWEGDGEYGLMWKDRYNMKEQKIGKLLVKVMMINKESEDGYALLHWKEPQAGQKATGDFAGRCYGRGSPSSSPVPQQN